MSSTLEVFVSERKWNDLHFLKRKTCYRCNSILYQTLWSAVSHSLQPQPAGGATTQAWKSQNIFSGFSQLRYTLTLWFFLIFKFFYFFKSGISSETVSLIAELYLSIWNTLRLQKTNCVYKITKSKRCGDKTWGSLETRDSFWANMGWIIESLCALNEMAFFFQTNTLTKHRQDDSYLKWCEHIWTSLFFFYNCNFCKY